MARINIFTTDHPMASESSWFDDKVHPFLSFVSSALLLALILTPLVLWQLLAHVTSDIGADNAFPYPWRTFVMGPIVAFALSLPCAFPLMLLYRLVARRRRKRDAG